MSFGPEYSESGTTVYFGAITGTHSSGKTTLLEGLMGSSTVIPELPDVMDAIPYPKFRRLEGIPVVFVPEATTAYMQRTGKENFATTAYSREDQLAVEEYGLSLIMSAFTGLVEYLTAVNETKGLVLADRTPLDGTVYRSSRLPGDSPWVSGFETEMTLHGRAFNTVEGVALNYETMWSDFLNRYCDFVIIPDFTEVPLDDNGARLPDREFRQDIAMNIDRAYRDAGLVKNTDIVRGTPAERIDQTMEIIRNALTANPIV
jgi:hypothetical protein